MRQCAIYARFSSDLQRESSIEDQIRRCREHAAAQGWEVREEFVRFDRAVSGAALTGRDALQDLISSAKVTPRPFDCILVEATSRLARDLADSLKIMQRFDYDGIAVVAVSQGID